MLCGPLVSRLTPKWSHARFLREWLQLHSIPKLRADLFVALPIGQGPGVVPFWCDMPGLGVICAGECDVMRERGVSS
jgi:hypothetical protein